MIKFTFQKLTLSILLVVCTTMAIAQDKYQLKNCTVSFFSEAPLENIEANNKDSKGIVDPTARNFAFRIPIKSFVFKKSLMQEHFNENYLESEKYPNASFKGTLEGNYDIKKNGSYPVTASGELEIHGVKQQRKIPAIIEVKDQSIQISSKFKVKLDDHKIKIPTLVFNKIAEEVEVTLQSNLLKM